MGIMDDIKKQISESKFCYAKEGGQGFVHKSKCTCDKADNPCQAVIDSERFHKAFEGMAYGDIERRNEIIKELKPQFKDSQWFRDNVVE